MVRFRTLGAVVVGAIALLASTGSASAATLPDVVGTVESAVSGGVETATSTACTVTGNSTLCALQVASYSVHTDYVAPDGHHVEKTTGAVLDVPTLVDVTGDGLADVSVELDAVSTSNVKLTINRLPTSPTALALPALIEAVINDPGDPTRKLNVGYDARGSNAPAQWQAQAALMVGSAVSVTGKITTIGAATTLTDIGGMFTQMAPGQRLNPKQARITYTPVPSTANIAFSLSKAAQTGTVSTSRATKADLDLRLVDGLDSTHVTGTLDKLQAPVSVLLDKVDAAGHETDGSSGNSHVHVDTQGDVAKGAVTVEDASATAVVARVRLALDSIPKAIDFTQTPTGALLDTSAPIGLVSGGVSRGDSTHPVPAADPVESPDAEYVHQDHTAGVDSTTFRIAGLQHVTFDASGPDADRVVRIGARLSAAVMHVLVTSDKTSPSTIYDATVDKVPHSFSLKLAPSETEVAHFCGSNADAPDPCSSAAQSDPAGIQKLTIAKAFNPDHLFGDATTLQGSVSGIPSDESLTISASFPADPAQDRSLTIDAAPAIGQVDLTATDTGVSAPGAPADNGIVFQDKPFRLAARIDGFSAAAFHTKPKLDVLLAAAGGHDFTYDLAFASGTPADPVTYDGKISARPAVTLFSLDTTPGQPTVLHVKGIDDAGNPAVTPEATLHAYDPATLFGTATNLYADIKGIPADEGVTITTHSKEPADPNTKVHIDTTAPILDEAMVSASDGPNAATGPQLPATDGVTYRYQPFMIAARVHGFSSAHLDTSPALDVSLDGEGGHDFVYDVVLPTQIVGGGPNEIFQGTITDRPAHTEFTDDGSTGQQVFTVTGSDGQGNPANTPGITLIAKHINSKSTDNVHNVYVTVSDAPGGQVGGDPGTKVTFDNSNGIDLEGTTANGLPIGSVDVQLNNDTQPTDAEVQQLGATLPGDGGGVIAFVGKSPYFWVHAHVLELRSLHVQTEEPADGTPDSDSTSSYTPIDARIDVATPQPFHVYINSGVGPKPDTSCDSNTHNPPHVVYHDVTINQLQPNTKFSMKQYPYPDTTDDCNDRSARVIEYSSGGRADSITYNTDTGDMSRLHLVLGSPGLPVPSHLTVCQATNHFCLSQAPLNIHIAGPDPNLKWGDTDKADNTAVLDTHGERTHVHLDLCSANDPGMYGAGTSSNVVPDPLFLSCHRDTSVIRGTFIDLAFEYVYIGYHYDTGAGFVTMNTNDPAGPDRQGIIGYIRYVNTESTLRYANVNFGYSSDQPTGAQWDHYYMPFLFAQPLWAQFQGHAYCANIGHPVGWDDTNTYFHAILNSGLPPDALGADRTNILCDAAV